MIPTAMKSACIGPAPNGEQYVLFDVTFNYTKADADNSTPSKSHYYVKAPHINPDRPKDWTAPVDYRNGTDLYKETGIYEKDVSMTSWWENGSILWAGGIKQMDLVIKDASGGRGHAHRRPDHEKFFPAKVRITMVQVSAGARYDAAIMLPLGK